MARSLLNAAKTNPIPGSDQVATVTLRLTRLEPSPVDQKEYDPRISRTVEEFKSMNVDVRLGERNETEEPLTRSDCARDTHASYQSCPAILRRPTGYNVEVMP